MFIIISYDIKKDRTRTRLAKKLKDFGPRVQKSVFEADIGPAEYQRLQNLLSEVKLENQDSIRLYHLCQGCVGKIRIWGKGDVTKDKSYYIC